MQLPAWLRWLVGAASVWPLVWMGFAVEWIIRNIGSSSITYSAAPGPSVPFDPIVVSFTMLVVAFVVGFCFWHLGRSDPAQVPPRAVWVAVLLLCGPFGFPIYWWVRIRPGASRQPPSARIIGHADDSRSMSSSSDRIDYR